MYCWAQEMPQIGTKELGRVQAANRRCVRTHADSLLGNSGELRRAQESPGEPRRAQENQRAQESPGPVQSVPLWFMMDPKATQERPKSVQEMPRSIKVPWGEACKKHSFFLGFV